MNPPPRSLDRRRFAVLGLLAGATVLGATAPARGGPGFVAAPVDPAPDRPPNRHPCRRRTATIRVTRREPTDGGASFFDELAALLASDPPPVADRPVLAELATVGATPGSTPSKGRDSTAVAVLAKAARDAEAVVARAADDLGEPAGTWTASYGFGTYGTDYLTRAAVAATLLAANVPEEATYYSARSDSTGQPLSGAANYRIHLPAGGLPPAGPGGFWSVTLYGEDNFLVDNPAKVYAVADRTPGPTLGADGSLDIVVMCGIFGNITAGDIQATAAALPSLCAPGALVGVGRAARPAVTFCRKSREGSHVRPRTAWLRPGSTRLSSCRCAGCGGPRSWRRSRDVRRPAGW